MGDAISHAYKASQIFKQKAKDKYDHLSDPELETEMDKLHPILLGKQQALKELQNEIRELEYHMDLMLSLYLERKRG